MITQVYIKGIISKIEIKKTKKDTEFAIVHVSDKYNYVVVSCFGAGISSLHEGNELEAFGEIKGNKANNCAFHNLTASIYACRKPKKASSWNGYQVNQVNEEPIDEQADAQTIETFAIPADEEVF